MNQKQIKWIIIMMLFAAGLAVSADDSENERYRDVFDMRDAEVIQLLEEKIPLLAKEIKRLREEDEEDYEDVLEEGRELLEEYYDTMEYSPELARLFLKIEVLNTESYELIDQFHDAETDAERSRIKPVLESKLSLIFDLQLEARMLEVKLLTEEIAEIREMVEKRRANKARILENHMREELEEEHDDLFEWW